MEVEASAVVIVEEDLVAVVVQESVMIFKREDVLGVIAAGTRTRATEPEAEAEVGGVSADLVHAMTSRKDSVQEAIPADSLMMAKEAAAGAVAEEAALVVQDLATTFRKANARAEIDVDSLTMTMEVVVVVEEVDLEFVTTFKRVLALEATAVDIAMMKKVAVEAAEAVGTGEEVMTEEGEETGETGMTEMTAGIAGGDVVEATEEGHGVLTGDGLAVMVEGDPAVDQDREVGEGDENYLRSSEIDSHRQGQEAGDVEGVIGHEVETAPGSGQEDDVGSGRGTGKETEGHQLIRKTQTHQSLTIRRH